MKKEYDDIWRKNYHRRRRLETEYDPLTGKGCSGMRLVGTAPDTSEIVMLPETMVADYAFRPTMRTTEWERLRCRHDFEFWCARCVTIKDKISGDDKPFILNAPQRRITALLESDRLAGKPMRMIMLKARQWGGSTLIQMYMAWIQSYHRRNWHSLICAHVKDTAATIRGMYSKVLSRYPVQLWDGDEPPRFECYERSSNVREIAGRGCRVTIGSSENQEAVRGADYAMAHLSEVAFWNDSPAKSPDKFIRAICGAIAMAPLSLVVMESTANGIGNYFHQEWCRSKAGKSDKRAVMVPWYEIEIYRQPLTRKELPKLWESMDAYERGLWDKGLTLEMINWYHNKRREYPSHTMMQAEYPTDDTEAFVNTGHNLFPNEQIEALRANCRPPLLTGEVEGTDSNGPGTLLGVRFHPSSTGCLKVWEEPQACNNRYVVAVDIGGRSASSDWSVIAVINNSGGKPSIAAQWRGHTDHDRLTWKSAAIARWYNNALLVIESNTLETENTEGDNSLYVLSRLRDHYRNLYIRSTDDGQSGSRVGFHTNRATKSLVINDLIARVRDGDYTERDTDACDELAVYELKAGGTYGAKAGYHDDILMTRAIGLYVARQRGCEVDDADLHRMLNRKRW